MTGSFGCLYTGKVEPAKKIPAKYVLLFFSLAILLVVAFLAGYFGETGPGRREGGGLPQIGRVEEGSAVLASKARVPIRKLVGGDGRRVSYLVYGSFPGGLAVDLRRGDKALEGLFVLRGDPLEREIPVTIGFGNGKTNFTSFRENRRTATEAASAKEWKIVEAIELIGWIEPEDEVELRFSFDNPADVRAIEKTLVEIYGEYDREVFGGTVIPADFRLFPEAVGVGQ